MHIVIYTINDCKICDKAKQIIQTEVPKHPGVTFEAKNVDQDVNARADLAYLDWCDNPPKIVFYKNEEESQISIFDGILDTLTGLDVSSEKVPFTVTFRKKLVELKGRND